MTINDREMFWKKYAELDKKYHTHKMPEYEYLVNFSQTKEEPISRWYYYVEGYSPKLVHRILKYLQLDNENISIFDPFAGSGTTLLTSKYLGKKSIGFEINPFSAFMINAKTQNYTKENIRILKEFQLPQHVTINNVYDKYELRIIENLFDKHKLEKIELLKKRINQVKDKKARIALMAALLSILESVSNYRKGGNGLKRKRVQKDLDPFTEFGKKINMIIEDLEKEKSGPEPRIINDSCLNMSNHNIEDFNVSIFSPPYANCFDPFEVYKIELWIGEFVKSYEELRKQRKMALTSNLNANVKKVIKSHHRTDLLSNVISYLKTQKLWDKRIPKMLDTYFYEMHSLLEQIYQKTKPGGHCVIVIGNSAYGHLSIPTDALLAQIGENIGFNVKEIIVARKNETSSQQYKKIGKFIDYIRESLVVMQK